MDNPNTSSLPPGTQVIGRVASILTHIGQQPVTGLSTRDLVTLTGLSRPTLLRMLGALEALGYVGRDATSGNWLLGSELQVLGALSSQRFSIEQLAREPLQRLADASGESAFFSLRRGSHTVCVGHAEGGFPLRSFVLYVGRRFPLGVASAGMAIFAELPEAEQQRVLAENAAELETYGPANTPERILQHARETRERGYVVNPGLILAGSWGMAAPVFDAAGAPIAALSFTGVESRFGPDRQPELGRLLVEEAQGMTKALARGV